MFSHFFNKGLSTKYILFVCFIALCIFFVATNTDIAIMLFISIVFACSLNPLVNKLSTKINRTLSTAIVLIGALLILGLLLGLIFALGVYQIESFASAFPTHIKNLNSSISTTPLLKNLELAHIDIEQLSESLATIASGFFESAIDFIKNLSSGFTYCLVGIIFIFFLVKDKKDIKSTVLAYFPSNLRKRTSEIISTIALKIGGYVIAQAMAITSVFVVMTICLLIFQVDYAILFALITGVLDIIPVVGPMIALIICLIGCYELGSKAIIGLLVAFAIAQIIENNFVRPYAYSKLMNLHPIIIFLSLILGAKHLGFVGVLFAPAIAATICVLLSELYVKNME